MPLSGEEFLAYAYLYSIREGIPESVFEHLWPKAGDLETNSTDIEYDSLSQVLWVKHSQIKGTFVENSFSARDFWRHLAEIRRKDGAWFDGRANRKLQKPKKTPDGLWDAAIRLNLLTKANHLKFRGAVVHGAKRGARASWFAVIDDADFCKDYDAAVALTTRDNSFNPPGFGAHKRAVRIEDFKDKVARGGLRVAGERKEPSVALPEMRVALDSTIILSADSFLGCVRIPDPQAAIDFEYVVTAYCGCKHVYLRKPKEKPKKLTPLLSLFWELDNTTPPPPTFPAPSDERLLGNFEVLLQKRTEKLFLLARHQLLDARMDTIYWTGGNPPKRLREVYRFLKDSGRFRLKTPLEDKLGSRFRLRGDSALLAPECGGVNGFVHSYLFNLIAKGPPYVHQPDGAIFYHAAWARRYASLGSAQERVECEGVVPWGQVLLDLVDVAWNPTIPRPEEKRFANKLARLREYTTNEKPFNPQAQADEIIEYFLDGLTAAEFIPVSWSGQYLVDKPSRRWRRRRVKPIVGEVVSSDLGGYGRTVEKLDTLAQRIGNGWRPVIADRDTFRLEWEPPPTINA